MLRPPTLIHQALASATTPELKATISERIGEVEVDRAHAEAPSH